MTLTPASERPWRILLVDDNALDRSDAKAALLNGSHRRYHFTEAASASETLRLCEQSPAFDCMVLDFNLPDGDALDVLSHLPRDADAVPHLPVVILTGIAGGTSRSSLRTGAQDYVGKAWLGPESLTWAVENAVERRKIAREVIAERDEMEARRLDMFQAERMARQESERLTLLKDDFLATLSHELRTPLSAIVGWASLLKKSLDNPATIRRGIEAIGRNAHLQAKLIDDLLDTNRIISGKLKLDVELIDIELLLMDAVEMLRPLAETKGVAIVICADDSAATRVRGDAVRLQQVFANLLTNALKFTPSGGRIAITIRALADSEVEVTVSDNGEGIDPHFIEHLFDRFSQANSNAARIHGGLGLGLSIVKQLAELHGGSVMGASAGIGKGATFTVVLPAVPEASGTESGLGDIACEGESKHVDGIDLHGTSVLLVDDNEDILELSRRLLAEYGASVVTVNSVSAALTHLRDAPPDVLVSDISMPELNGYDLINEVRHGLNLDAHHLPAVAISAFSRLEDKQRALDAGYQAYIVKPLRPHGLIQVVASLASTTKH